MPPRAYFLCVFGEACALAEAAASDVHNDLESFRGNAYPSLGELHTLFGGEHIAFAG